MAYSVPTTVRSNGIRRIGDQCCLGGPYFPDNVEIPGIRIPLNIEFGGDDILQVENIVVPYMSFIGPGMHGYAFRPKTFAVCSNLKDIGIIPAAGIPECGKF